MSSFDKNLPHAKATDLHRYEIDGDYSGRWEIYTDYTREQVLMPGFFTNGGMNGLSRLHLIDCWCEFRTTTPTRMTVTVSSASKGKSIEVVEMDGTFTIKTAEIPWHRILDCPVASNSKEIGVAYKRMAAKIGKNKKEMARLKKARDFGCEINCDRD